MPKNPIQKRKDGRYRYRVTDAQGKRLELTSAVGEKRKDFALRCDALDQKSEGESFDQDFNGLFTLWLTSYVEVSCSTSYRRVMAGIYKKHVKPWIGRKRLEEIKKKDVYQLLARADKAGSSSSVIKKIRMCVSAPYAWAEKSLGLAVISPTLGLVYKVKEKKTTKRDRVIKDEDLARFLEVSDRTKYKAYFRLLATTGLRPSEGLGIQAKDLEGDVLHIRRAVTRMEFSDLKTSAARRDIPLTPELKALLYAQRRATLFQTKESWLFPSGGGPPAMVAVESCFKRCLKATTVYKRGGHNHLKKLSVITPPIRFSLYDFRHTFATKMAERGMGAKILQYLMGHEDIATTLSYYIGVTDAMREEAIEMMAKII